MNIICSDYISGNIILLSVAQPVLLGQALDLKRFNDDQLERVDDSRVRSASHSGAS